MENNFPLLVKMFHTPMNVHQNIKKVRILRGKTREELADQLGLCVKQYANLENGKSRIDIERFVKIAGILEVSVITLLELDEKGFLS
jgi:transcriptional regulator with XRE-family HTH domain